MSTSRSCNVSVKRGIIFPAWLYDVIRLESRRCSRTMVAAQTRLLVLLSCISLVHNDKLRFLVLGDWGGASRYPYTTSYEIAVNKSMSETADRLGIQFTIALGKEKIAWFVYLQKTSWIERAVRSMSTFLNILAEEPHLVSILRKILLFFSLSWFVHVTRYKINQRYTFLPNFSINPPLKL